MNEMTLPSRQTRYFNFEPGLSGAEHSTSRRLPTILDLSREANNNNISPFTLSDWLLIKQCAIQRKKNVTEDSNSLFLHPSLF